MDEIEKVEVIETSCLPAVINPESDIIEVQGEDVEQPEEIQRIIKIDVSYFKECDDQNNCSCQNSDSLSGILDTIDQIIEDSFNPDLEGGEISDSSYDQYILDKKESEKHYVKRKERFM